MKKRFERIYVEITNICNLSCKFCPKSKRHEEYMSVKNFEKIIEKIKYYTNTIYLHVKGEPLLHPNLDSILKLCNKSNIDVYITTNGTLLNKNIKAILENKIRRINISLHSTEQNSSLNKQDYLKEVFSSCNKLQGKVEVILRLWNLQDISKNEKNIDVLTAIENEFNISNIIEKAKENKGIILGDDIYLNQDMEFTWPDLKKEKINSVNSKCLGLRKQLAILVDGTVTPCCLDQDGDICLGNIFNQDLEQILESKRAKEIIKNFENGKLVEKLCFTCGYINKFKKNSIN